jgi:hypothetical protein
MNESGETSADKAVKNEAQGKESGTYEVTVTGTVTIDGSSPEPTPIGDYRAKLKKK